MTASAPSRAGDPAELVSRLRQGDASAWRDLVDQYEPLLRWLARQYRLPAEDAEDAVQLTWLRCLEHLDQLTEAARLSAWLTTICRRESLHLATRRQRETPVSESQLSWAIEDGGGKNDPCAEVSRRDAHDQLHRSIAALPQRQRGVLVELLTREGQSYLDLAQRAGLPVGSVGPTRQRAFARLRNDPRLAGLEWAS